ncbi:MAG: NADH-quinone oxidoreductase subunit N [Pseudomonadales bacterium]|nr:NADH-quinone oxidoreductase subunit N [Halioglobus sp.]MCP5123028.1 NADH-quinone oxidoreductase subunit N [Pseudomonadales bacterium]
MNAVDFQALLPLLVLAAGAILLMVQIAWHRNPGLTAALAAIMLVLAALSCRFAAEVAPLQVTPLLLADRFALLFCTLFGFAGAITAVLSRDYVSHHGDEPEEFFLLLVLATMGACVLAYAVHVASLLLGMELLSISLYALIAYPNKSILPLEAAAKYLVLSGAASATALFGFALLYAATGSLGFTALGQGLAVTGTGQSVLLPAAVLVFAGLAFKLSIVPFHLWTPDVYDGAPAPVTGFLASVAKAAVFVVLLRLFLDADLFRYRILVEITGLLAIFSMLAGNLLALLQSNIKRMLAYSSIAHLGYLLIVFMVCINAANQALAVEAASFYLIAYTATTIAAFGLLTLISTEATVRENIQLQHVSGLFWRQPLLACLMLVALLSLAGIPLTAGFIAKFYLVTAAVSGHHWVLLFSLVAGSSIGIYYYLRVIYYMTRRPEEYRVEQHPIRHWRGRFLSGVLIAAILLLGVAPQSLMYYLRSILL